MKKLVVIGLAVAGFVWARARREERPVDTWSQATDPV